MQTPTEKEVHMEETKFEKKILSEATRPLSQLFPNSPLFFNLIFLSHKDFRRKSLMLRLLNFLDIFKKIYINISFVDAWEQMSNHAKFMKKVLSKRSG